MLLTRWRRFAVVALGVALGLPACETFEPQASPNAPAPTPSADAGAVGASRETLDLFDKVRDEALRCAKSCEIHDDFGSDIVDVCKADLAQAQVLAAAVLALETYGKAHPNEVQGEAEALVRTARLFADWMVKSAAVSRLRGTLRLFQDFADAWNRYRPAQPIPVDPVSEYRIQPNLVSDYRIRPVPKTHGRVLWKHCYDGPCIEFRTTY
jgi:hypothetical protein